MQKVAIVVVSDNRKKQLDRCLTLLMSQTHKPEKIYIADNYSSDGTDELAYSYTKVYGDIIEYSRLPKAAKKEQVLRFGFLQAMRDENWDYLLVIDDKSTPEKKYIEKLLKAAEKHPEIKAFVGTEYFNEKIAKETRFVLDNNLICSRKEVPIEFFGRKAFCVDTTTFEGLMVHKSVIKKIGMPDDSFFDGYEAVDYCFKIRKHSRIINVTDAQIKYSEERQEEYNNDDLNGQELRIRKKYIKNIIVKYGYIVFIYIKNMLGKVKH